MEIIIFTVKALIVAIIAVSAYLLAVKITMEKAIEMSLDLIDEMQNKENL